MIIHHHIVIDQGSIGKLTIGEHAQGGEQGDSLNHTLAAVHLSLLRLNVANLISPSSGNLIFPSRGLMLPILFTPPQVILAILFSSFHTYLVLKRNVHVYMIFDRYFSGILHIEPWKLKKGLIKRQKYITTSESLDQAFSFPKVH